MKKTYQIPLSFGGIALILLLLLPLIPLSVEHISNSTSEIVYADYGVYLSYYGAVLGAVVGGAITLLGVLLTLDKQEELEKQKRKADKAILLSQLSFSYDILADTYKECDIPQLHFVNIGIPKLIIDTNWLVHLASVKCLTPDDIVIIKNWFTMLRKLDEEHDRSKDGTLSGPVMKMYISVAEPDKIKVIIDKLESDTAC